MTGESTLTAEDFTVLPPDNTEKPPDDGARATNFRLEGSGLVELSALVTTTAGSCHSGFGGGTGGCRNASPLPYSVGGCALEKTKLFLKPLFQSNSESELT